MVAAPLTWFLWLVSAAPEQQSTQVEGGSTPESDCLAAGQNQTAKPDSMLPVEPCGPVIPLRLDPALKTNHNSLETTHATPKHP